MAIKLSNNKKRQLVAMSNQAIDLILQGHIQLAEHICNQADQIAVDFPDILYARGQASAAKPDYHQACEWFSKACKASPRRAEFLVNYAGCLRIQQQDESALDYYKKAYELAPRMPEAAHGYASCLASLGEFQHAINILLDAVTAHPTNPSLLIKLACIYNELANNHKALELLKKALTLMPHNFAIHYEMALYSIQSGQNDSAREHLRLALRIEPGNADALSLLISSGHYDDRDEDIAHLKERYSVLPLQSAERAVAAFALGNLEDKAGHSEMAFTLWQEGNQIRWINSNYNEAENQLLHDVARSSFPAERFSSSAKRAVNQAAPIFIVGMPRSGSTLLEQALARHPSLHACGEMYAMGQSIVGRGKKVCMENLQHRLKNMDDQEIVDAGHEYHRRINEEYGIHARIIDKALDNYVHCGLITMALPNARMIHIRREPMASCLSMFQQDFGNTIPYSFNLEALGRHFSHYLDLMQYWRKTLPEGHLIEVDYESLVNEPEKTLRWLLDACNLKWSETCLSPHESNAVVTTSSRLQVRKPIHRNSVARWKQYEEQLEPFIKQLTSNAQD